MKNVVFDLGGVVVDWSPERLLAEYPGDKNLLVTLFQGGFFHSFWSDFDRGVLDQVQVVREMSRFAARTYAECWDLVEFIKHSLRDLPATQQLIRELSAAGYHLFCLSNMSLEFYDYLKDREVFACFEGQIISAREKLIKPEKEIFELLIDRYGLQPEETLFIDDLADNVSAARDMGFHTVHLTDKIKGLQEIRTILGLS